VETRIEGSNPSVSARTPGSESPLGCDAWKLIRVPFRDSAADAALRPVGWAGRSQEKFWHQFRRKVVTPIQ